MITRTTTEMNCQNVFKTLLKSSDPILYARELITQTEPCDEYFDMQACREDYKNALGLEGTQRLINYRQTEHDVEQIQQAYYHHSMQHKEQFISALYWIDQIVYKFPFCKK
jgi:hypothetical protein